MSETDAEVRRAWRALEAGDYEEAARLFEPLAAGGSETALLNLGWMHKNGHLGPADLEKAMSLWEKAARGGSARARNYLETTRKWKEEQRAWRALEAGDYDEAARQYEPLAVGGSETALLNLGCMYRDGRLGPPDLEKAVSFYEKAARTGSASAKYYLGRALKDKGDLSRARSCFIEGAKQGYTPCMYMGGKMLMRGQGGEVESQAGYEWLVRAADGGHAFAQRDLLRMQIRNSGSLRDRLRLYRRSIAFWISLFRRMTRDRDSVDFR